MKRAVWVVVGILLFALAPFTVALGWAILPLPSQLDPSQGDLIGVLLTTWGVVLFAAVGCLVYGYLCVFTCGRDATSHG